ncbi:MAG: NYN domain-containing protein [Gemmatimonadota bacterium]|nr:NYN domain-containing protein [Gemmatimonadota bacterium]MDE2865666.1 NYN domain-containing protein [Gemmatimonadota bacterium]
MTDTTPSIDARHRVRVFVDFWNYTLHMKSVDQPFRTDWSKLGPVLSRAATQVVDPTATGEYQGLNFYGSYNPAGETDRKLHRWATGVVDTFPGVKVSMAPRQKKRSPPSCPRCHQPLATCPGCGADMRGTEEKGVDVRMATDMISLAWVDNYDIAVLVSSDRDFVPVAEFLETRGIKVIHGAFPPKGSELTARCWASINVARLREQFRFAPPSHGGG